MTLADGILALQGTQQGAHAATFLALAAAALHAVFGALQKGRHDPWLSRGAMDAGYGVLALPLALIFAPLPSARVAWLLAGAWVIHTTYKLLQASAYDRGAYTVVYPVVRGTGPLVTVLAAGLVFGERFTTWQWLGVGLLSGGIFGLAAFNLRRLVTGRDTLPAALAIALATGVMTAAYTTWDAYGIRAAQNPLSFLLWFFVVDAWVFPLIAAHRWRRLNPRPALPALALRGVAGGAIALASFGSIMLATFLDKVGEAAVLRETSTVFAALIGWLALKETVGPVRTLLMAIIATGAVVVEFGG